MPVWKAAQKEMCGWICKAPHQIGDKVFIYECLYIEDINYQRRCTLLCGKDIDNGISDVSKIADRTVKNVFTVLSACCLFLKANDYFVTCLTFSPDFLKSFLYFVSCLDGTFTFKLDFVPLNACFPTVLSFVDLTVMLLSFLHPLNALFLIVVRLDFDVFPTLTAVILLQPENALPPMVFTLSVRVSVFFKEVHPLNAFAPIEVTFLPKVIVVSFVHPENAFALIAFTLLPMVRLVIFLLFCIAFEPMEVTLYFTPSVPVTVLIVTFAVVDFDVVSSTSFPAFVTL